MRKPKIGLALGSGGAVGLSQIGVIKTLEKHGIYPDYIAGSSMGSFVGAYYALNKEINNLENTMKLMSKKDFFKLMDFISLKKGIIGGKRAMGFLGRVIGDKDFSQTKIPLKIVATELKTGKEVLFHKGKINQAVRASTSIPGFLPPAKIKGKYYVDGGVINPTPVDVVKKMGADIVIAVDHTLSKDGKSKLTSSTGAIKRSLDIMRNEITKNKIGNLDNNVILLNINKKGFFDTYKFYNKNYVNEGTKIANKNINKIKKAIKNWRG
jgi:NTE family protein